MIDYKPTVVTALKTIGLPVYYEMFVDSSTPIPCITYIETSNTDSLVGDTLEYSNLVIQVKVWAEDVKTLETNAILIDSKMKELGFRREFGTQLFVKQLGQYVLRYRAIGFKLA